MADDPKPDPVTEPDPKKPDPAKPTEDVAAMKAALAKANKEAADLRVKFKELEDKEKSESEKLAERVTAAERKLVESEAKALRLEVASAKGLEARHLKYLSGATKEELEARADEILEDIPKPGAKPDEPKPNVSQRPRPSLSGGGDPTIETEEADPAKLASQIRGGL